MEVFYDQLEGHTDRETVCVFLYPSLYLLEMGTPRTPDRLDPSTIHVFSYLNVYQ